MKQEKALIHFYARVVAKGQMNLMEVPLKIREKVRIKALEEKRKLELSKYKEL